MTRTLDHVAATTVHARRAEGVSNRFAYAVDYVLLDPDDAGPFPALFSRAGRGFAQVRDRDHGGPPGAGRGVAWVRGVLEQAWPGFVPGRILLLAQPRVLGHVFNPVSFWLVHGPGGDLVAVIAEVTNTWGDRHSYLCHDGLAPIHAGTVLKADKRLHVSPFQPAEGTYAFRFDIRPDRIAIRIDYARGDDRLVATLAGPRRPLTSRALLGAALRRPFGSRRVLALIHWQALVLWWKGAAFRGRPAPPGRDVSGHLP